MDLLQAPDARWCALIKVEVRLLQIRRKNGWGNLETIDLSNSSG